MSRLLAVCIFAFSVGFVTAADEPVTPKESATLFNGKNLDGLTPWLKDTKREDPKNVFRVADGVIHMSGDGFGYLATARYCPRSSRLQWVSTLSARRSTALSPLQPSLTGSPPYADV